jgi:hypothetical protein
MVGESTLFTQKKKVEESPPVLQIKRKDVTAYSDQLQQRVQFNPCVHQYKTRIRNKATSRSSLHALTVKTTLEEPSTYEDAVSSPDSTLWKNAMDEKLSPLDRKSTWTLTTLPPGHSAVKCRKIF